MTTANQVIAIAKAEVGVTEWPSGSNKVKYWDAYTPHWNGEPWCDRFVSWCGWRAGASDIVGVYDYCPYHENFFRNRGQWIDRSRTPKPGDTVFFAGSDGLACHIGIVTGASGAYVYTIEGNTSSSNNANGGRVEARTRTKGTVGSKWYIKGYGRPNYESEDDIVTPEDKEQIAQMAADKVVNYMLNDVLLRDRIIGTDIAANEARVQLTRTDDPTGRGKESNLYDRLAWMAQKQEAMKEQLDAILTKLG